MVVGGSMSKVRVYEVAKQLNLDPKAVVGLFQSIGVTDVRNHMSSVDVDAVEERIQQRFDFGARHGGSDQRTAHLTGSPAGGPATVCARNGDGS